MKYYKLIHSYLQTIAIHRHGNNGILCVYCNLGVAIVITTGAISINQALMINKTLLELHMQYNQIDDDGITTIAGSLSNSSITLLDVLLCDVGVVGAQLIMKSAVENGVCEYVEINSEYKNDKEVKKMKTILDDRRTQNVRNHKLWCII